VGQKIHPKAFRLGINEEWDSVWYAKGRDYARNLLEDNKIREYLKEELGKAGVSRVRIKRRANQIEVDLFAARPGMIIGKGGSEALVLRDDLKELTGKQIQLNIMEEEHVETNGQLLAESVATALEKRVSFRRAMKQVVNRALKAGGLGVKIMVAGRLGGSEIARTEWYREGRVPLHTLRANINYGFTEAFTIYGKIGVKVWVYRGEVLPKKVDKTLTEEEYNEA
jgi:small subunit ribosomal protein S3